MVTEACTVLTSQPGLCRPTEAVNVFVWDCCRFISILQSLFLYSCSIVLCFAPGGVQDVCILLYLLRLSTQTAPSLLCKLAELDVLPSPPLQAARGQGQGQPLLISSRPGHLFCTGGGDRNQCSKLPLLVRRNQYLAIKPGEACLGITA